MAIINGAIGGGPAAAPTPAPPVPSTYDAGAVNPGSVTQLGQPAAWNVTPNQTVEGRIQSIIASNNPIIQMARTQAAQDANSRGLLNSSIGVQAGEAAAFGAATPIATTDAATAAKAASFNADTANTFAQKNVDALNTRGGQQLTSATQLQSQAMQGQTQQQIAQLGSQTQLQVAGQQTQAQRDIAGLNAQTQTQIASLNADTQTKVAQLNTETQKTIQQLQAQNQTLLQTNGQAANAMNQALVSMTSINTSTTMDANAKTQAIAAIQNSLQSQLKVLTATSGLNLSQQLNFATFPGFDANGNFVGFDGTGNTAQS